MKTRDPLLPLGAALALLLACQAAAAQVATLTERETNQRGNFAVGAGTDTDNGNYLLDLLSLDPQFSNVAGDSGAAAGGSASFSTAQAYALQGGTVVFSGAALTAVDGPASVVTYADALSQLALVLLLDAPTPFELRVDLVEAPGTTVNGLVPRADAQVRLAGPGDVWLYNGGGSFVQSGVLAAGTWNINAFADARGNGDARFAGVLTLSPVPEPAAWLLLVLGAPALLWRRVRATEARQALRQSS